jgi:hypothetical protein
VEKRKYRQVHDDYLIEWLGITYPPGTWRTNVRMGDELFARKEGLTEGERLQLLGLLGACADAVVFLPTETHIIEAMVRHEPGAAEDLLKYKWLLPYTSTLKNRVKEPIRLFILTPLELGGIEKFYNTLGIEVKHYSPMWIIEYLHSYPHKEWRGKLARIEA